MWFNDGMTRLPVRLHTFELVAALSEVAESHRQSYQLTEDRIRADLHFELAETLQSLAAGLVESGPADPDQVWLLWDRRDGQHLLAGIYTDPATARAAIPDWHWYQVADDPVWYARSGQVCLVRAGLLGAGAAEHPARPLTLSQATWFNNNMTSSPAADAAATPVHTDGPDCDACPSHADWVEHHCYGCGKPYDAETAALLHQAFRGGPEEQAAAIDQLAARPSEHKDCLQ